jgi:hypothetical protein
MASTADAILPGKKESGDTEVPVWRLYLIRAISLWFVAQGLFTIWPNIIDSDPVGRGMITSMLGGLWVMALLAIRYPLQMIPIFLFEFVWKAIWALAFGLPQWMTGRVDPQLSKDLFEIGFFSLVFAAILPWGYVWRHYVKQPSERWR